MHKQNYGFICELCGGSDFVPSIIKLDANYGSKFDGESISLCLCGKCTDRIFEILNKRSLRNENKNYEID